MTPAERTWMTLQETAEYLRLSYVHVRRLAASGELRSSQAVPNGTRRVRREWADEWADLRESA
jgi:excisionase family DNA binding protein